ncbi:MAG: aspartate/glutamate racemase family protein [Gemmatimonadales bacterium]|nr:MAG: aspartate/glutamate racemase family protein [Gemmatimonadales bacterium]
MKTIGLIGGMSWESTVHYYRIINESVRDALGGLHSAKIVLYSVDLHQMEKLQAAGSWDKAAQVLASVAVTLESAGAELLVICTNTMHNVAPAIEAAVGIPLLHIADPTADAIKAAGLARVGLLGTRFTMEQDFYRDRLETLHGIEVLIPGPDDRETVHHVIYQELCRGVLDDASRTAYRAVIQRLVEAGAQAIILGCTEIGMLVQPSDSAVPLFDTTELHARAAARWAMSDEEMFETDTHAS